MPGAAGQRPLEKAAGEDDVRPHQVREEIDHRRKADQFADGPADPLRLFDGPALLRAIAGVPHLGFGHFPLDPLNDVRRQDAREDDVAFDFEMPYLFRVRHRREIGLVDVHEPDVFFGGDRRHLACGHGNDRCLEISNIACT